MQQEDNFGVHLCESTVPEDDIDYQAHRFYMSMEIMFFSSFIPIWMELRYVQSSAIAPLLIDHNGTYVRNQESIRT
jgi:hypothetical protein